MHVVGMTTSFYKLIIHSIYTDSQQNLLVYRKYISMFVTLYYAAILCDVTCGKHSFVILHYSCTDLLQLEEAEKFHYLNQSGCISDPTINDVKDFESVRDIMVLFSLLLLSIVLLIVVLIV